jgi:hypothetical protein
MRSLFCLALLAGGCTGAVPEEDHPQALDTSCAPAPNATPYQICELSCNPGWGDCDGQYTNGCETPLTTTSNCGACNNACSLANASAACSATGCTIASCNAGYADCDGNASNGCETDLSSPSSCGACGNVCPTGDTCNAGTCIPPAAYCGDGICNNGETHLSCPDDCPCRSGFDCCGDGICRTSCVHVICL